MGKKQQLFSAFNSSGLQGNKPTGEQGHTVLGGIRCARFLERDVSQRVTRTSSDPDQPRESEGYPLGALHIGGIRQAGMRGPSHQRQYMPNSVDSRLTPVTNPKTIAFFQQKEGQGDVTT